MSIGRSNPPGWSWSRLLLDDHQTLQRHSPVSHLTLLPVIPDVVTQKKPYYYIPHESRRIQAAFLCQVRSQWITSSGEKSLKLLKIRKPTVLRMRSSVADPVRFRSAPGSKSGWSVEVAIGICLNNLLDSPKQAQRTVPALVYFQTRLDTNWNIAMEKK